MDEIHSFNGMWEPTPLGWGRALIIGALKGTPIDKMMAC
jgi:hypothetical protein